LANTSKGKKQPQGLVNVIYSDDGCNQQDFVYVWTAIITNKGFHAVRGGFIIRTHNTPLEFY